MLGSGDQGETYHDILWADAGGNWSYVGGPLSGPNLTATSIDNSDNTSEFSTPFSFEVGYKVFLPLAIKNR